VLKHRNSRKTDFRSSLCYGLLYTRKSLDQLETASIINTKRGFKTHPSSFKRRFDNINFKVFDDLISILGKFDKDNFPQNEDLIAIDGLHQCL
jgi:hypothetical protein